MPGSPRTSLPPDCPTKAAGRDPEQAEAWQRLRAGILRHAVQLDQRLSFDIRLLLTQTDMAHTAGRLLWARIKALEPQVLVAPGFGAMPLAYATAHAAWADGVTLNVLMVRDQRKTYHQKKWVEGHRPAPGARAVVVDDFMESGSVLDLVDQALAADAIDLQLQAVAVFFDMWEPLGSRQIQLQRLPVIRLFTRHDVGLSRDCHDAQPPSMTGSAPDFVGSPLWWRLDLNTPSCYPYRSSPVIADNAVFVADNQSRITRHHAWTGDIEWVRPSLAQPGKGIVQQLSMHGGSLVYGCYDGTITRLDACTGEVLWRWRQDTSVHATPTVDVRGGRVFINTEQWNDGHPMGHLIALDWTSGRLLWQRAHAWWPPGSPAWDPHTDTVVATCNDQTLIACQASTGELLWRQHTQGLVRGRPLITQGKLVVATESGWLQCLDLQQGQPLWKRRYGRGLAHQFLAQDGPGVMAFDARWHWTSFDLDSGHVRWITRLRSPGCWGPVACQNHSVALSQQGHLAVMDLQQQRKVWEGRIPGRYGQSPATGVVMDPQGTPHQLLAAASHDAGLQVFAIHPHYTTP